MSDDSNPLFMECDACRSKPGMPFLCGGCLFNRSAIQVLTAERDDSRNDFDRLRSDVISLEAEIVRLRVDEVELATDVLLGAGYRVQRWWVSAFVYPIGFGVCGVIGLL